MQVYCTAPLSLEPAGCQPSNDFTRFFEVFNKWVASSGSCLFTVRAGPKGKMRAKDLAAEIAALKDSSHPILWYLSERGNQYRQGYLNDTELSRVEPDMLNLAKFQNTHSDAEWVHLLLLLLGRVQTCYTVIETEALYDLAGRDQGWSQQLQEIFNRVIDSANSGQRTVKVLLVTYADSIAPQKVSTSPSEEDDSVFATQILAARTILLVRRKRMLGHAGTNRYGLARQLGKVKLTNSA